MSPIKSFVFRNNEKGMVLIVVILIMAVLLLIGTTAMMTTATDMKISANYKAGLQAFYIADAGIERARNILRSNYSTVHTVSAMLAACSGGNGALSDSADISHFYAKGVFATDDSPLIADTVYGGGTYRVYLTNDPAEGPTNTTDNNMTVTLTSFGRGANNAFSVVQAVVRLTALPPAPGAIVLPGPVVNFLSARSISSSINGGSESAISLNSILSQTTVKTYLGPGGINRINNYTCDAGTGASCIKNEAPADFPPEYRTVRGVNGLVNLLRASADIIYAGPRTLNDDDVGTTFDRKTVVVEGDAVLKDVTGAGILVVTGQLTLTGQFNYNGLILVAGKGHLLSNGGGDGAIKGSIVVVNTNDALSDSVLGKPTFDMSEGGGLDITYDAGQINPPGARPFVKIAWKQM